MTLVGQSSGLCLHSPIGHKKGSKSGQMIFDILQSSAVLTHLFKVPHLYIPSGHEKSVGHSSLDLAQVPSLHKKS